MYYLRKRSFAVKKKRFSVEQIVAVLKQARWDCRCWNDPPGGDHRADPVSLVKMVQGAETDQQ
jgi:hypothetical protein